MKYDDASWHFGGGFPGLPLDRGATHIGMFLGWAILRDLVGDGHRKDAERAFDLDRVRNRHLRPLDFFLNWCDEAQLTETDLSAEGNAFAVDYYRESYLPDWADLFRDPYGVDDSWENFDRVVHLLDRRFVAWQEARFAVQVG